MLCQRALVHVHDTQELEMGEMMALPVQKPQQKKIH